MLLWRISNHASLDGGGGLIASARWHTRGHPVLYLAETPAGALVEVLVHLELDPAHLPRSYKLLKAEAPDDISLRAIGKAELAADWTQDLPGTRNLGDDWLRSRVTALLRVPSAIVPETFNLLLNPHHPDAARLRIVSHRDYPWDKRLLE
ncbi:MAG TPA: RES family NAD+ phosphorylase [Terriglobales bacterium]|nr:RES family NAD+ phosphorylase [Terriglobales bacterium]